MIARSKSSTRRSCQTLICRRRTIILALRWRNQVNSTKQFAN